MTGYVTFDGAVTPVEWGESVYTVLPLPYHVLEALGRARRVEGEIADHPVNLAITRAPVLDRPFLWTGKSLLKQIGIAPGEMVEIRLRSAKDDDVDVPEDVSHALRAAGLTKNWDDWTPGKQRGGLHQINIAMRPETRSKRIQSLLKTVRGSA